jgi:PST family polysaccharide transporter
MLRPFEQLVSPFEAVVLPILSRLQTQPDRYRAFVLQMYDAIAVVAFPVAAILLALAHPLTVVILGPPWEAAASIVRPLTLIALYYPVASIAGFLLSSQGRGKDVLFTSTVASISTGISFLVGIPFGPEGVATAYSVTCLTIHLPLQYYVAGRRGPITTGDLWSRLLRHLPVWALVGGGAYVGQLMVFRGSHMDHLAAGILGGLLAWGISITLYPPAHHAAGMLLGIVRGLFVTTKVSP